MITDEQTVYDAIYNAAEIHLPIRKPKSAFDFGDRATIGMHLKRNDYSISEPAVVGSFGIYLGEQDGTFVVGIKSLGSMSVLDLVGIEEYKTLEELKQVWRLD